MQYKILSDKPIDGITIKKIRDCLVHGRGNIVVATFFLKDFVDDFKSFDGKIIQLGNSKLFLEVLKFD